MTSKFIKQIIKFVLVGVINTGIDIAVLKILVVTFSVGREGFLFTIIKAISFIAAVLNSYFMNKYWTFIGSHKRKTSTELSQFIVVSIGGLLVNTVAASLVFYQIQPFTNIDIVIRNWSVVAALFGSAAAMGWNFFGYKKFVFKHHHPDLYPPA
jgi:putative flippase GtrA